MDSWRRQKGEIHHRQDMQGSRSQNRKPPIASWQPTVPSWEKKFCTLVGSIPWQKLLETKKSMYLYDNVVKWNDSAGEEAFHNAKNRFWAEINNLPCDITLPDPDIYIDEIDWNSEIDPELIRDLEREPKVPDETDKKENVLILGSALLSNQSFSCTGWGDVEEDLAKHNGMAFDHKNENSENLRDHNYSPREGNIEDSGWGQLWDNPCGWDQRDTTYESNNLDYKKVGDWGARDTTQKKIEGGGQNMSRYKTSKFQGDNRQTDCRWRNVRGRQKASFAYERQPENSRQWNSMNYCGQNHNNGFGKGGIPYRWEKQQVL
ncbi:hypothetical protein SLE2022_135460 [Rubroshorea leprosula]